jgi:hypothetical protein
MAQGLPTYNSKMEDDRDAPALEGATHAGLALSIAPRQQLQRLKLSSPCA